VVERGLATSLHQPVTFGVPWPRGLLADGLALSLLDPAGRNAPLQTTPLARWSDGSVKWLLVDFLLDPIAFGRGDWTLSARQSDPARRATPETALRLRDTAREIVVDTGTASFRLDRTTLAPISQVDHSDALALDAARTQTVITDARGHSCLARIERSEIESRGPVRATICFEGTFASRRRDGLRFRARLSFFARSSLARVELSLRNPRRARHRGGLWDLGDPGSVYFRDLSLRLASSAADPPEIGWIEQVDGSVQTTEAGTLEIYQDSSGGENWRSRNHVNGFGEVPCRFRGYRVRHGSDCSSGFRASPVVSVRDRGGTITAAIPEFWQQFPKAIDTEHRALNLRLFPGVFGDLFELQGGEQKTHTVWFHFGARRTLELDSLAWVHRPARVRCAPEWYAASKAIPYLQPPSIDPRDRFESYLRDVIEGPRSFFSRREVVDEYGWRNYGEVYADHERAYYKGDAPVVSHYNNQYDVVNGLLIQYCRTGDARWLELADPLARHVIDIDIYHTNEDRAAYNGGLFWHTDHYRDAATSTHRAYSRANCGPVRSAYGGGPCSEHNYTTGLLHYYYLTGDPGAREAVLDLANWVVAMDDGRRTILSLLDDGPTGLASSTSAPDYHGPGRGSGNSINAVLDGWLLTGSRGYLDKAEGLIRRAVHPAMDIPGLNLLEAELRWSYTVFLSVLARYLNLKAEAGEIDAMYAYAQRCLLAVAAWMVDNEIPYFDYPEKLEYPTETWAAQELRKANVLRLAAQHADEPLRRRLIERGGALAERAWSDLLRFESRDVTRSVALLMTEGTRDSYWRRWPIDRAPAAADEGDFGPPQAFIPQKQRVFSQLKSPRGVLHAMAKLMRPQNWQRFMGWPRGPRA
jgi:hypothetical protein